MGCILGCASDPLGNAKTPDPDIRRPRFDAPKKNPQKCSSFLHRCCIFDNLRQVVGTQALLGVWMGAKRNIIFGADRTRLQWRPGSDHLIGYRPRTARRNASIEFGSAAQRSTPHNWFRLNCVSGDGRGRSRSQVCSLTIDNGQCPCSLHCFPLSETRISERVKPATQIGGMTSWQRTSAR